MSNYHLRDENLSLKAKGLLSLVLSLPEKWDYSIKGLESICKESANTIMRILQELISCKYLKREREFGERGRIKGFSYVFYEFPYNSPYLQNEDMVKPYLQSPYLQNAYMENEAQLNTNILITELLNTEEINKEGYATTNNACEDRYVLKEQIIYATDGRACSVAFISDAQLEALNKDLGPEEFDYYMRKLNYLCCEGYQHSCSDYEYIMRMVEADRKVKKGVK